MWRKFHSALHKVNLMGAESEVGHEILLLQLNSSQVSINISAERLPRSQELPLIGRIKPQSSRTATNPETSFHTIASSTFYNFQSNVHNHEHKEPHMSNRKDLCGKINGTDIWIHTVQSGNNI